MENTLKHLLKHIHSILNNKSAAYVPCKVYGLKTLYSPKLLELASVRCWIKVMVIVSSCINFTVFSFEMVSNKEKVGAQFGCYVASSG